MRFIKPEIVRLLNKDLTALYVTELKLPESKNKLTTDEIELLPSAMYKALYIIQLSNMSCHKN